MSGRGLRIKEGSKGKRRAKYGNVQADGYDSKREANRARELQLLLRAGEISELQEQVWFEVLPAQHDEQGKELEKAAHYVADFVYQDNGQLVVEDTKGVRTPDYVLKRKLMLWRHGIRVKEI